MDFGLRRVVMMFVAGIRASGVVVWRCSPLWGRTLCCSGVVILDGLHLRHWDGMRRVVVARESDFRRRCCRDGAGKRRAVPHQDSCVLPRSLFRRARRQQKQSAKRCACKNDSLCEI